VLLETGQIANFLAAAILVTLAPGPDNLMVLSLGLSRGRRQGMAFGIGCALGCLSHTVLAALGISAMIAASPLLFGALRLLGGGYLLWLGIRTFRRRGHEAAATIPDEDKMDLGGGPFVKGLLANAVNPKVILFFLAFLPQFVETARGEVWWQIMQLGLLFTVQAGILFAAIGWFSGRLGQWFTRTPKARLWLDRLAGSVFVALGARLMVSL
jgi:threonine/homoserine/homoserine lactone efflux protein